MPTSDDREPTAQYLLIVSRDRPDILARARERLAGDRRIEVVADRRHAERRTRSVPEAVERRRSNRRGPDVRVCPTLFVRKRLATYEDLQEQVVTLTCEAELVRAENERLRQEVISLNACLHALAAAEALRKTSASLAEVQRALDAGPTSP
jgi:hypothetical protein